MELDRYVVARPDCKADEILSKKSDLIEHVKGDQPTF